MYSRCPGHMGRYKCKLDLRRDFLLMWAITVRAAQGGGRTAGRDAFKILYLGTGGVGISVHLSGVGVGT